MCGIFGFNPNPADRPDVERHRQLTEALLRLSVSRGQDASGVAVVDDGTIRILKRPISGTRLIRSSEFAQIFRANPVIQSLIGHARMETNGSFARSYNNQPIVKDGCVMIHNGIIVNADELWRTEVASPREYEVDTEIVGALLRTHLGRGHSFETAARRTLLSLEGAFSLAIVLEDFDETLLATNTGSLYYAATESHFLFASERFFLQTLVREGTIAAAETDIRQLYPGTALLYNPRERKALPYALAADPPTTTVANARKRQIIIVPGGPPDRAAAPAVHRGDRVNEIDKEYERNRIRIDALRRCTRCVLPETMPFIAFDEAGVCTYCQRHRPQELLGVQRLEELVRSSRTADGRPDCVVPFSGGRDSSYGLWYIKSVLKLNPITFTYDWGMVTDLARRNIARVCGKLGVENILISADITRKRANVKMNVEAWLHNPRPGLVPLFMAGDKYFLALVNRVKAQTGVSLDIWLANRLENTDFKVGFCGIAPGSDDRRIDALSLSAKVRLALYYGRCFIENPRYVNRSVWDTLLAFHSYYFEPRTNYQLLYDYVPWNEREIEEVLFREFDWEIAPDTTSTWRIGDGTVPFYNYIYYTIAGFTEIDTFRSNQVREGTLSRSQALELTQRENAPRIPSLLWYLSTIGVDFDRAIRVIHQVPKLYDR